MGPQKKELIALPRKDGEGLHIGGTIKPGPEGHNGDGSRTPVQ